MIYFISLTFLFNLAFCLAQVFFLIKPLLVHLSKLDTAVFKMPFAFSLSFSLIAFSNFLILFFTLEVYEVFEAV